METLLERISVAEHRGVYDCFEEYENCLRGQTVSKPYSVPDRKAKIYAYCAANGIETQPTERDYCHSRYWDLDSPEIEPLKRFSVLCNVEVDQLGGGEVGSGSPAASREAMAVTKIAAMIRKAVVKEPVRS